MIRVLIVSPQARARAALERVVAQDSGMVVVDRLDAHPDVIVMAAGPHGHLPRPVRVAAAGASTPVVVLLDDLEAAAGARALRAGARAVLSRDAAPEEIGAAVRAAAAGLASLPAALAVDVLDGTPEASGALPPDDGAAGLTPREREILVLLGEGLVNKEIGARLDISEHTVKTHLAAIYEKLDVSNRAEAVATGLRRGLVML